MVLQMDASPIMSFPRLAVGRSGVDTCGDDVMGERTVDTSELRRKIASGEYRLDAHAIAEAMFARADRDMAPASLRSSKVLEARQGDGGAGGVE